MANVVTFSKTKRGKDLLILDEIFMFTYEQTKGDGIQYWTCQKRGSPQFCKSRLRLFDGKVLAVSEHNHPGSRACVDAHIAVQDAKKRAAETAETPRQIYQAVSKDLPLAVGGKLPVYESLQRTMERVRKAKNGNVPAPNSLDEIDHDLLNVLTTRDQSFLRKDETDKNGSNRLILFATQENLKVLTKCSIWFGDGTFKVAPQHFYQVYAIHGMVGTTAVPLAYFLLPNKTGATYDRAFRILREEIVDVLPHGTLFDGPQRFIVDFEPAPVKSFRKVFDKTELHGCLFHLGQNFYRKIQEIGDAGRYASDVTFNLHCKMILAIAFVPAADVKDAWLELEGMAGWLVETDGALAKYFVDTYIGPFTRTGGQRQPIYAVEFWNCNERVMNDIPRTTNPSEAWHNVFNNTVGCAHPAVYDFVQKLLGEQAQQELLLHKLEIGEPPKKRKCAYEKLNKRLFKVVSEYDKNDKIKYLENIAANLGLGI